MVPVEDGAFPRFDGLGPPYALGSAARAEPNDSILTDRVSVQISVDESHVVQIRASRVEVSAHG